MYVIVCESYIEQNSFLSVFCSPVSRFGFVCMYVYEEILRASVTLIMIQEMNNQIAFLLDLYIQYKVHNS
jgi:hypothetical protein